MKHSSWSTLLIRLSWVRPLTQNRARTLLFSLLLGSSIAVSSSLREAKAKEINPPSAPRVQVEQKFPPGGKRPRPTPRVKREPLRPNPPDQLRLTPQTDSGSSNRDNITTNAQPALTGIAAPGSTIQLYEHGKRFGTTTAAATGTWQFPMPTPLAEGGHRIAATATTSLGESLSASLLIVIDRTPPTVQLQTLNHQPFLPLATTRAIAAGTRFVGAIDGTGSPIRQLTYQLTPSSAAVPIPVSKAGLINHVLPVGHLSPGQHQLRFTAIDVAGNQQTVGPYTVVVAPTNTTENEPSQVRARLLEDTGRDARDGLTNRADIVGFITGSKKLLRLEARLHPPASSGASTAAQPESLPFRDITALVEPNGTFGFKPEEINGSGAWLPDGRYTLELRGEFAGGSATVSQPLSWTLDTTAPLLDLSNLSGTPWSWNDRLRGTVKEATGEVTVLYDLRKRGDQRPSSRGQFTVSQVVNVLLPEFMKSRHIIEEEVAYDLTLTALDRAGNRFPWTYQFFIPGDRRVVDDDVWKPK